MRFGTSATNYRFDSGSCLDASVLMIGRTSEPLPRYGCPPPSLGPALDRAPPPWGQPASSCSFFA